MSHNRKLRFSSSSLFHDSSDEERSGIVESPPSKYNSNNNFRNGMNIGKKRAATSDENPSKRSRVHTAKELEILRRQRQVAAQLSLRNVSTPNSNKPIIQKNDMKPEAIRVGKNSQQLQLEKEMQKKRLQNILKPTSIVKSREMKSAVTNSESSNQGIKGSTQKHIRPSKMIKKQYGNLNNDTTTAEAALAAARDRLQISTQPNDTNTSTPKQMTTNTSSTTEQLRTKMRKRLLPSSNTNNKNRYSSFLSDPQKTVYPRVQAEDYWRYIRDWDFIKTLNGHVQSQRSNSTKHRNKQNRNNRKTNNNPNTRKRGYQNSKSELLDSVKSEKNDSDLTSKVTASNPNTDASVPIPIPNVFHSIQQYKAMWAPLCLQESSAQIISEFVSSHAAASRCKNPLKVNVSTLNKDVGGNNDCITVQLKLLDEFKTSRNNHGRDHTNDSSYLMNDIVLLTNDTRIAQDALSGNMKNEDEYENNASLRYSLNKVSLRGGLLGHVEQFKRSPDGLFLRISRKIWSTIGRSEMFLIKIGGNVTAFREFVALSRIDTIPLIDNILCNNKEVTKDIEAQKSLNKNNLIASMGGSSALGKGFTQYARRKFNDSQLEAISAAAQGYGEGGFTLVKGPPGTGKTTTLVALLNSLHIRQFNKYYQEVGKIAATFDAGNASRALENAAKHKPRLLVCAPSNAAVDNVILKIMSDGFVDGNGSRYNPSMVRIGVGQSLAVKDVALETKVDSYLDVGSDLNQLEASIAGYRIELIRLQKDISKIRRRIQAITLASPWPLSREWEIRIDEKTFDRSGRVYFVNHKTKTTTYEIPPKARPDEHQYDATAMPEYRTHLGTVVKLVERYNKINLCLQRAKLVKTVSEKLAKGDNRHSHSVSNVRQQLETQVVDSVHIVLTTLGTAGSRTLDSAEKFEVVVIDEAAQSVEPATLVALQLGSSHAILVGDPQQLPATIFSVSGRGTKYDRSIFQRLEEAGHRVHLLDTQYRMNPGISNFPRRIFYDGNLLDGSNVKNTEYGNPLHKVVISKFANFQPFTILDLDSFEERGGTSLSNSSEAQLVLHLYCTLENETGGLATKSSIAVITPYAQQANLLRRTFGNCFGENYTKKVEINTVDAFQGRESDIVIFSCVRAAGSKGIGFLSDVRRMNVALTRAKHFLFVIARCSSIVVNPYWRDLVRHASENKAIIKVPLLNRNSFPDLKDLEPEPPLPKEIVPSSNTQKSDAGDKEDNIEDGEVAKLI